MYNINEGRNIGIVSCCRELRGYAYFVDRVRYHESTERKRDPELDKEAITNIAIRKAIQDCKDKGLLLDFWDKLTPEEINMLGSEWDLNIALEVEREEGLEEGRVEGLETAARNALGEGASIEFVKKITGLDDEAISRLQET